MRNSNMAGHSGRYLIMPVSSTIMPNMSMKKPNLGFIQLSLMGWMALGAAAIILGLSVSLKIQTARLDSVKQEYAGFVADVKAKGEAAKVKADQENKLNQERKVKSDESLRKLRIANESLNQRLRDNAARSVLPEAPADSRNPEYACFSRADIDRALQRFIGGTAELIVEGTEIAIGLNVAREWAQGR